MSPELFFAVLLAKEDKIKGNLRDANREKLGKLKVGKVYFNLAPMGQYSVRQLGIGLSY